MKTRLNAIDNDRYYANATSFNDEDGKAITKKKNMYTTATKGRMTTTYRDEHDDLITGTYDVYIRSHEEPKYKGGKDMGYINAYGEEYFNCDYLYKNDDDEETEYHNCSAKDAFVILENIEDDDGEIVDLRECMELPEAKPIYQKGSRMRKTGNEPWRWRKYNAMKHTLPTLEEKSMYQNSGMSYESYNEDYEEKNIFELEAMKKEHIMDVAQKVDGGVSREEISFLGMNCTSSRNCTFAWGLVHNPKWLLKRCKELKDRVWMTPELKEYLWELLRAALNEDWKVELERLMSEGKHIHIEIYPPTRNMKEGFINIKAKHNGQVIRTKRICFLDERSQINRAYIALTHIEESSRAKGYVIHKQYMDPAKVSYRKARSEF